MHLIEQYSLASGVKIDKPLVSLEFFPIPFEKYIVFHAGSAAQPRRYDYFNEVLFPIKPELYKRGIGVVQIGGDKEELLDGAFDARGSRKKQMQFIIKNSLLVVCNDTCSAHFASGTQTPSVVLFGNSKPQNSKPYWSSESICSILQPDYEKKECSYQLQEEEKRINEILPEEVTNEICKKLGLELTEYKTVHIGSEYNDLSADLIPNFQLNPSRVVDNFSHITILLDECDLKELDFVNLMFWCSNFKIKIKTKGKFSEEKANIIRTILSYCKYPLLNLDHEIQKGFSLSDLDNIKSLNVEHSLKTKLKGEDLDNIQLDFFEESVDEIEPIPQKLITKEPLFIRSKKAFIADGRIYLTKWHRNAKIDVEMNEDGYYPINGLDESWDDIEGLIIKKKNGNEKNNKKSR